MDSREYIEPDRGKRDRNAGDGDEGERETGRTSIGRRPRSAIRYIALQGVYRFTGSYQLSLLGDISMISARKRDRVEERVRKRERKDLSVQSPGTSFSPSFKGSTKCSIASRDFERFLPLARDG